MIEAGKAEQFYRTWHSVDPASISQKDLAGHVAQMKTSDKLKSDVQTQQAFQILHRVAHQTSEQEWLEFAKTGEVPPLKLSAEEMDLVRGGAGVATFLTCFAIGYMIAKDLHK